MLKVVVVDSKIEREDIRGCILPLLFENLKDNGVQIDLTGAEVRVPSLLPLHLEYSLTRYQVYESFENEECGLCFPMSKSAQKLWGHLIR